MDRGKLERGRWGYEVGSREREGGRGESERTDRQSESKKKREM